MIPGSVWKIILGVGDKVEKGTDVAILESMKMEFPASSEFKGTIEKIYVKAGQQIHAGQLIMAVKTEG